MSCACVCHRPISLLCRSFFTFTHSPAHKRRHACCHISSTSSKNSMENALHANCFACSCVFLFRFWPTVELAKCCYWDVVRAKAVSMRQMSGNNTWPANCMSVPVTSCLTVEQLYAFLPLIRTRHGKFDGILQLAIKILTVGKRQAGSWQLAVLTFRLPKFNSSDNVMRACLAYEGVATFFTLFRETMKKMKLYLE